MTDIASVFKRYSELRCLDLLTELPTCEFDCNSEGIYYFTIEDPDALVTLLTVCLGEYRHDSSGKYHYQDGTVAKFIKSKHWYEFKKHRTVIARIKII